MTFFLYLLIALHVIISLFLIGVVLLQTGKSADLAGAFGGQGSQTAFGPRGAANLLTQDDQLGSGPVHGHLARSDYHAGANQRPRPLRALRDQDDGTAPKK